MEFIRQTRFFTSSWSLYFRRSDRKIILNSLLEELFTSYDIAFIQSLDKNRIMRVIRHIGKCMMKSKGMFNKSGRIREHLRLIDDKENVNNPYIMFMLNIVYISFLYGIAKKNEKRELNSLKSSVDNLINIYSRKVDTSITKNVLHKIANIMINSNLIYYRPEESSLIDELDELLETDVIKEIPILHMLLNSIKITILHI